MSILNNSLLLGAPAASSTTGVSRSLRFNAPDSAYLSRTPASAGNRKTWTWAGWVKRASLGRHVLFSAYIDSSNYTFFQFNSSDQLQFEPYTNAVTTAVFRDFSAWYHIVCTVDTTQATQADRVKIYVNGTQQALSTSTGIGLNADTVVNAATIHNIASGYYGSPGVYTNGSLADVYLLDGQALDPTSFTDTDATTGQLIPKAFSGTYGTNGFHLDFADNSAATATTLGKDTSGNGNNWTPNNLSVTAGAGNDSLVDVPTNGAQTDTGAGGEVRGNYCTWNPLTGNTYSASYKNGNLEFDTNSIADDGLHVFGSIQLPASGKWYWETAFSVATGFPGINSNAGRGNNTQLSTMKVYNPNGQIGGVGGNSTWTTGDVIGAAYDADAGTLKFYKNGVLQGTTISSVGFSSGPWWPQVRQDRNATSSVNFGQRAFAYTAPSGFKALCTTNLPAPLVTKPSTVMDVTLYTGNGSTQTISGLGFSPDLVWIKSRVDAFSHRLQDTVRGVKKELNSDLTAAEYTYTVEQGLTAFNSDGFTLIDGSSANGAYNKLNSAFASWCWDAGTSTVTNTQGSISSSVRANATAGFSIVGFDAGSGGQVTMGHGLGVAPGLIILKRRAFTESWYIWINGFTTSEYLRFDTAAKATSTNLWGTSLPSSTLFGYNANSGTHIAYCFAPVVGYSSFGSYTGNGSTDGPFCWTGFRPRFILQKRTDSTGSWQMWDTARNSYNETRNYLLANTSDAEVNGSGGSGAWQIDILSNGFKVRSDGVAAQMNASGGTYVWAAFAESPFNYSRAR